jgi:hypothetical protein
MTWTDVELGDALSRFEQELVGAHLTASSVRSSVLAADRFLRWRVRHLPPLSRAAQSPGLECPVSTDDLSAELDAFEQDLTQRGLSPSTIRTYLAGASRFVRWLDGLFVTLGPLGSGRGSRDWAYRKDRDLSWAWEGNVQQRLVAWLVEQGWHIEGEADTQTGQHGVDIRAVRGPERLAVEVKGHPQATYARGERAGQPRRWHPAAQVRTYFGNAIHAALVMRDSLPETQIALAFPSVGYGGLLDQVHQSLIDLGILVFVVREDGRVLDPFGWRLRLPGKPVWSKGAPVESPHYDGD